MTDDATLEALAVLERLHATNEPDPQPDPGPDLDNVAMAMCETSGRDPYAPVDLDPDAAARIRHMLDLDPGQPIDNVTAARFHVLDARAERRWLDLDARARTEGWRTANFAQIHKLHQTTPDYAAWETGRAAYDPTWTQPADPSCGSGRPIDLHHRPPDLAGLMDSALREAAVVARQNAKAGFRGVEIRVADGAIAHY